MLNILLYSNSLIAVSGIGFGKKYNPATDELGFSVGQFEIYRGNTTLSSYWRSFIFVPAEAVQKTKGKVKKERFRVCRFALQLKE